MRIAQISPLYESVPPSNYGGTERVVSYVTEELVRMGHEVTLFASGDSRTSARLIPACDRSLRLDPGCVDRLARHMLLLERVLESAEEYDILHFHVDYLHFPIARRLGLRTLTTLHGRLDIPDLAPLYREFREMPLASISDQQRRPLPFANWQATVYHGLPETLYRLNENPDRYLAFLGRASREKRLDLAIEIARRSGMRLRIAAKVDAADRPYFDRVIAPLLRQPFVEFLGEIGDSDKNDFLGNAYALLFPIDWLEPFGLAMIEAMACGTPVVAFNRGSVPEVIEEGTTGFIVENVSEAVRAVKQLEGLDRAGCRRAFERRFTASRMALDYLAVYARLLAPASFNGSAQDRPEEGLAEDHKGRG